MERLAAELKRRAVELGFDLVGIAAAGPADPGRRLARWLEEGMHGGMGYMARTAALRADPGRVLPGCRSVVAVAMSYRTSLPPSSEPLPADRVWISRYAWGRDYHRVLKKRLVRLGRWLESQAPHARWRAFVDTGPVLERAWAARAGLGWIGKSTSLINRRLGSELFLGVLLVTLELPPDPPATDHCGRCTACLDACPAGAFPEPGVLDARRCVAYLTVEHRGELPREAIPAMGRMVAGCDVCQEVCPWTRRAPADLHPEFLPAGGRYRPRLADLEALDEAGWRRFREGSPLGRIPFAQLRRNLAAVRENLEREGGAG